MNKNKKKINKTPTILQVLPHLNSGGLVSGAVEVAFALKKNKFKSVIASAGGYRENEVLRSSTILEKISVNTKNPLKIIANKRKIIEIVNKHNVSIIHARSRAPAWSAYWAAKELKIPFVTTFHGTYGTENFIKKKYNRIMLKGNKVIAISEFIKKHIEKEYKHKKNIVVVPRGVNLDLFSPKSVTTARVISIAKKIKIQDNEKIILMPARLTEWKGHKLAIKAISNIKNINFKLVILGDVQNKISYKKRLVRLANSYNVLGNILFVENTRDMPGFLMLSDVVLSCSTKPEAFGRVILEAQAMGRPVVAFRHGGAIELIEENENGIMSKVGDIKGLSANIITALNYNYTKRKNIARLSIKNVKKKYLTEFMCERTIKIYKDVLKDFNLNEKNINN